MEGEALCATTKKPDLQTPFLLDTISVLEQCVTCGVGCAIHSRTLVILLKPLSLAHRSSPFLTHQSHALAASY